MDSSVLGGLFLNFPKRKADDQQQRPIHQCFGNVNGDNFLRDNDDCYLEREVKLVDFYDIQY